MKVLEVIKKHEKIIVSIVLLIITMGVILNNPIKQTDEITLFYETFKMNNGHPIYKEVNVLVTPLFFYIGVLLLKIFSPTYLTYRIFGTVIWVYLFYNIYSLLCTLKVNKKLTFLTLALMPIFLRNAIVMGANYNILAIALILFATNLYLKCENKDIKSYITQGILIFLIFMTKQNIGGYYAIALVILEFNNSNTIKEKIKNIFLLALPTIIGFSAYLIYLYFANSLYNFIDYVFLGMLEFQRDMKIETGIILISLINIIPVTIRMLKKRTDKNQEILFIISIIMLLISYPIFCDYHSRIALIFSIISFVYLINVLYNEKKILNYIIVVTTVILVIYNIVYSALGMANWSKNYVKDTSTPYYGVVYNEEIYNVIRLIEFYIKSTGKKVVFFSPISSIYNLELNTTNGILDLPVVGNVGLNGEEKLINAIKNLEEGTLIIKTRAGLQQEYSGVHEFIEKNYKKIYTLMDRLEVYE